VARGGAGLPLAATAVKSRRSGTRRPASASRARDGQERQTSSGSLAFRLDRSCLERVGLASDAFVDRRIQAGQYQIRPRLRVDGIESFVIKDYGAKPLAFIDAQTLVIP
jgi:hypothetical protein